jgi:hypothetical protein
MVVQAKALEADHFSTGTSDFSDLTIQALELINERLDQAGNDFR